MRSTNARLKPIDQALAVYDGADKEDLEAAVYWVRTHQVHPVRCQPRLDMLEERLNIEEEETHG